MVSGLPPAFESTTITARRSGNGRWRISAVALLIASACNSEMSNGTPCPEGTSAEKEQRRSGPGFVEWCARDDGTRHGPYVAWTTADATQPSEMGTCAEGRREGVWTTYSVSGAPSRKLRYRSGLGTGPFVLELDGKLMRRGTCAAGKATGFWEDLGRAKSGTYDDDGRLLSGENVAGNECEEKPGCP